MTDILTMLDRVRTNLLHNCLCTYISMCIVRTVRANIQNVYSAGKYLVVPGGYLTIKIGRILVHLLSDPFAWDWLAIFDPSLTKVLAHRPSHF